MRIWILIAVGYGEVAGNIIISVNKVVELHGISCEIHYIFILQYTLSEDFYLYLVCRFA